MISSNLQAWYYMKNAEPVGPVSYEEMISLRQNARLIDTDQVWNPSLDEWTPLAHCQEFTEDRMKTLFYEKGESKLFAERRNPRTHFQTKVLVHDHRRLVEGTLNTVSDRGASLDVLTSGLVKGDSVVLHFAKTLTIAASFNCRAEVIEKKLQPSSRKRKEAPTRYVVRFESAQLEKMKNFLELIKGVTA